MIEIPKYVKTVLEMLEEAGYEAWCVGGCVRDGLLGRIPGDWDVTTSAMPEETMAVFGGRTVPTGLQHGTVTVRADHKSVEVTTYRVDGAYHDHRRPDSVSFTHSLEEDLRRRDFTINAMAINLKGELRDPFGGQRDLKAGVLRCVGDPDQRFCEDALRILRGIRFAAVLGFDIDSETAVAQLGGMAGARMNMFEKFVAVQSDAALRQVAGMYAYDENGADSGEVTLRGGGDIVNDLLTEKLNERLSMAGLEVVEARINYLAYAPEIAAVMLRRQQAAAIISAREKIVEGAVSMVKLALDRLSEDNIVELDEEKKAAMVSNLLVVLCSEENAQPVINSGTLNH